MQKEAPAQSPVSAEVKPVPLEKPAVPAGEQLADLEAQLQTDKISLLHQLLSSVDPSRVNVADDDTIQELVAACTALKPRLVEVICEYEKKRDELVAINADFAKARASYDKMLAAALTRSMLPILLSMYFLTASQSPCLRPLRMQRQDPVIPLQRSSKCSNPWRILRCRPEVSTRKGVRMAHLYSSSSSVPRRLSSRLRRTHSLLHLMGLCRHRLYSSSSSSSSSRVSILW